MREIEFRAWYDGHMYRALAIDWENRQITMCRLDDESYRLTNSGSVFDDTILHRPTGLEDKNGAKIYEGDILDTHVKSGRYMKVYYNEDCVSFMTAGLGDIAWVKTGGLGKDMCSYIEVIGNIHQNPELLERII